MCQVSNRFRPKLTQAEGLAETPRNKTKGQKSVLLESDHFRSVLLFYPFIHFIDIAAAPAAAASVVTRIFF